MTDDRFAEYFVCRVVVRKLTRAIRATVDAPASQHLTLVHRTEAQTGTLYRSSDWFLLITGDYMVFDGRFAEYFVSCSCAEIDESY